MAPALLPLLALVPALVILVMMLGGRSPVAASAASLAVAVVLGAFFFRVPFAGLWTGWWTYFPTILEVMGILLFGMLLASLLRASGAMDRIVSTVSALSPTPQAGAALVALGLVPFAESVTGFGIGITVGVPILASMGFPPVRAALLGLCGMVAAPWGALGPGISVAADLGRVDLTGLGVATAWINAVQVAVCGAVVVLLSRETPAPGSSGSRPLSGVRVLSGIRPSSVLLTGLAALVLWGGILGANVLIGTPVAGVIGSGLTILVLLGAFRLCRPVGEGPGQSRLGPGSGSGHGDEADAEGGATRGSLVHHAPSLGRALLPYGVLTVGLVLTQVLAAAVPGPVTRALAVPPLWLAVAMLVALWPVARPSRGPVLRAGVRSWVPVGLSTALFMVLGWVMSSTGMSASIGEVLARAGAITVPALLAASGIVTGSNTSANAMFASSVASLAGPAGPTAVTLVALGNSTGALATMATPSRVAMAAQLATGGGSTASAASGSGGGAAGNREAEDMVSAPTEEERRSVERAIPGRALAVVGVGTAGLTALALFL